MPVITDEVLAALRARPGDRDARRLASALLASINALHDLQQAETDPGRIRALASALIDASGDLQAVLGVLQEKIGDDEMGKEKDGGWARSPAGRFDVARR